MVKNAHTSTGWKSYVFLGQLISILKQIVISCNVVVVLLQLVE